MEQVGEKEKILSRRENRLAPEKAGQKEILLCKKAEFGFFYLIATEKVKSKKKKREKRKRKEEKKKKKQKEKRKRNKRKKEKGKRRKRKRNKRKREKIFFDAEN